ncbi:hypothetical protein VNO80_07202 [Phaseolus coccineus]|uniref:Uncharacterized protein n=1 Tax=Phaseolus coccineus TaxID=3886 RepID=A0AAN9NJ78_PHACN
MKLGIRLFKFEGGDQVNNAGIDLSKQIIDHTAEDVSTVMATNFESAFHLTQLAHPLLKESGSGNIVFISSITGVKAVIPLLSAYSASKGAMNQFTKNVALEWAKDNIRANVVAPGPIWTPLLESVVSWDEARLGRVEAAHVKDSAEGGFVDLLSSPEPGREDGSGTKRSCSLVPNLFEVSIKHVEEAPQTRLINKSKGEGEGGKGADRPTMSLLVIEDEGSSVRDSHVTPPRTRRRKSVGIG